MNKFIKFHKFHNLIRMRLHRVFKAKPNETLAKINPHLPKVPLDEQCRGYSAVLQYSATVTLTLVQ